MKSSHTSQAQASFVGDACMNDNWLKFGKTGHDLVCEAKEIQLISATATVDGDSGDLQCNQGEMVTVTLTGDVHFNAARYDPGWYVATDGGDALSGTCAVVSLSRGGSYSFTNGGQARWDKDEGSTKNAAGDLCGDVMIRGGKGTMLTGTDMVVDVPILCNDSNGDGTMDVGVCFSWRTKGTDGVCMPKALYPGTTSKCYCQSSEVSNMKVVQVPDKDPVGDTVYNFTFIEEEESYPYNTPTVRRGERDCLNDVNWDSFVDDIVCASNEVQITKVESTPTTTCVAGENVTVSITADVLFDGAKATPGWFVGTDGGDALAGVCHSQSFTADADYSFTNGGAISYSDSECGSLVAIGETTLTGANLLFEQEVPCIDDDEDGYVDVS